MSFAAAYGNSIRTFLKYWEDTVVDVLPGMENPIGTPLVYELKADLKPFAKEFSTRLRATPSKSS